MVLRRGDDQQRQRALFPGAALHLEAHARRRRGEPPAGTRPAGRGARTIPPPPNPARRPGAAPPGRSRRREAGPRERRRPAGAAATARRRARRARRAGARRAAGRRGARGGRGRGAGRASGILSLKREGRRRPAADDASRARRHGGARPAARAAARTCRDRRRPAPAGPIRSGGRWRGAGRPAVRTRSARGRRERRGGETGYPCASAAGRSEGSIGIEHHGHLAPLHAAAAVLHLGDVGELAADLVEDLLPQLRPPQLPVAEEDGHLDLVALLQELASAVGLAIAVVLADARPVLDLFDLDGVGLLARLALTLLLLVAHLAPVHHADDRGIGVGTHLDQVEAGFVGPPAGIVEGDDAELFAVVGDQPDRALADPFIDAGFTRSGDVRISFARVGLLGAAAARSNRAIRSSGRHRPGGDGSGGRAAVPATHRSVTINCNA